MLAAIGASAVTQDFEQGLGVLAIRDTYDALRPRKGSQFSGLLDVADQQEQKFSRTTPWRLTIVSALEDAASKQGGDFRR
jgi:hypothetical protein